MRKLLKILMYPWEQQKKRKQELERLLKVAGVKLIKERNTSITLSCLKYIDDNKGTHSIVNEVDNSIVYDTGLTSEQAAKRMAQYTEDAKKAYHKLSGDEALSRYMDDVLETKIIFSQITDDVINHANKGEFSLPANPKISTLSGKMKVGGHGQNNIEYLNAIGRQYKIEHTYSNGVRIGSVQGHDKKVKRIMDGLNNTGQSWFPKGWNEIKIKQAYEYIIQKNFQKFKNLKDGPPPLFDTFEGVRVGVMKTTGKPATIFPDNAMQPIKNSSKFEINPF